MLGNQNSANPTDISALVLRGTSDPGDDNRARKGRPWCDHCKQPGHTRETCWKIHGKPADWKPSRSTTERKSHGNVAGSEETSVSKGTRFSKEQKEFLHKLISQSQQASGSQIIETASAAQKGNF